MAKAEKTKFVCSECGGDTLKWQGKCPHCNQWNTLVEEAVIAGKKSSAKHGWVPIADSRAVKITEVDECEHPRTPTGIGELDRVLGGGVVYGSFVLLGGEPGAGKSTLVLQALSSLAAKGTVLYVTGEESAAQISERGTRLGAKHDKLYLLVENCLDVILDKIKQIKPSYLVIDSIQTIYSTQIDSAPGSVSQVRECGGRLMQIAKSGLTTFLIGHVTKDGAIAGPRTLEHMVDTCLFFEQSAGSQYRVLRAVKNRFGSTNEIGLFEVRGDGLRGVPNPSEIFLAERPLGSPGSVVIPSIEGSRPILVEVQALVSTSTLGNPRRTTLGFDSNRCALLLAVLEKKVGMSLAGLDVFLNIAGGLSIREPASDLGVLAALASSHMNRSVPDEMLLFGEVGLAGEVRAVANPEQRIYEAQRLGFTTCIVPTGNMKALKDFKNINLIGIRSADEAIEAIFS